jgi:hypothetical protein
MSSNNFYEWEELFPELEILKQNIDVIAEEVATVGTWMPWPEDHFALNTRGASNEWAVFPFLHTFPAFDDSRSSWLSSTMQHCPKTTALLKAIPNIKTALFSRLGPGTTVCIILQLQLLFYNN